MALFSTQKYGDQWSVEKELADLIDKPDNLLNEKTQKRLGQMVSKLRETVSTAGWKEIIEPFIRAQLRPERLLNLTDEKKAEARVFLSLLRLVENLLKFKIDEKTGGAERPAVKEKAEQEGEDEEDEMEVDGGMP